MTNDRAGYIDWIPGVMGRPLKHKVDPEHKVDPCTTRAMTDEEIKKYGSVNPKSGKIIYHGDRKIRTFNAYR